MTINPNIKIVDADGNEVPRAPVFKAARLTDAQVESARKVGGNDYRRHIAALALAVDKTLRELDGLTVSAVAEMANAAAGAEGVEIAPIVIPPDARATIYGAATTVAKASIAAALAAVYGSRLAPAEDAPPAAPAPKVEVAYTGGLAPVVVPLIHPITVDGVEHYRFELHSPAYGDVQSVATGAISRVDMIAAMAGVSAGAINGLRTIDAERVVAIALAMTPDLGGA